MTEETEVYRDLAKKLHPDVNKDPKAEEGFKKLGEVYDHEIAELGKNKSDSSSFRWD